MNTTNPTLTVNGGGFKLSLDAQTGQFISLTDGQHTRNWLSPDPDARTGLPFVNATGAEPGHHYHLGYNKQADALVGQSAHGATHALIQGNDQALTLQFNMPDKRGPRSGIDLSLDHLDMEDPSVAESEKQTLIHQQLMPVIINTAQDFSWAYLVWHRADDDLLLLAIEGVHAGWYIQYSYAGHRMQGFQVYNRADDVIAPEKRFTTSRPPASDTLKIHLAHACSREDAIDKAADLLNLKLIKTNQLAVMAGHSTTLHTTFKQTIIHTQPDGEQTQITPVEKHDASADHTDGSHTITVTLDQPGQHHFHAQGDNASAHATVIMAMPPWKTTAEKCLAFHREHYQTDSGAFARILNADLQHEGRNFGGNAFGNPEEGGSCRTGEFGGYGAWSQMIHQVKFGPDDMMQNSARRYFDWMLNKGRQHNPRPGTLSFEAANHHGMEFSAYHFKDEICYAQHEAWMIEQMADGVRAGFEDLYPHLVKLVQHYLSDHVDENGVIWNQNWPHETPVDYSTVDCPMVHLYGAGTLIKERGDAYGDHVLHVCRQQAEHLLKRGFDFPTEGEPCTEDGSIACQAWGLAFAYNRMQNPDPQWIEMANALMQYHSKLEMSGLDIRSAGSTLRFWETMYESDDWGPSINAGHGWTLWSALARWELFIATGKYQHLDQAWKHTTCVASRIQENGAMPCSYTPDPIPALPHDTSWGDPAQKHESRQSTAYMGHGYPSCYSMSGMHLFIFAPQCWYDTIGFHSLTRTAINASYDPQTHTLQAGTALSLRRIALSGLPQPATTAENADSIEQNSYSIQVSGLSVNTPIQVIMEHPESMNLTISTGNTLNKYTKNHWEITTNQPHSKFTFTYVI